MNQGIFYIPQAMWVSSINGNMAYLVHDPRAISPECIQEFGDTRLHSVISKFHRHRDKFIIKSFDLTSSTVVNIG